MHSPDADRVVALLDGQVMDRQADRLAIRSVDPAALTAQLVGAGLRVTGVQVERRTLEDVVLSVSGTGSDRLDVPREVRA